ncbi:MAG: hypothetical protein HYR58_08315 [Acidobacteria bacterium]|nr:hypothetical protein [Acidobacteriota bacterium]
MSDKWMTELAALTGLTHYPKQGPFAHKDGALIGDRDGYILAIGPATSDRQSRIVLMLRFPEMQQPEGFRELVTQALENAPTFPDSERKAISKMQYGADFFLWQWNYSFGKPKADQVAALVTALVDAAKQVAPKFAGKCEICKSNSASEVLLHNNVPGYYCSGCQEKLRVEGAAADQAYEELPTNLPKGLLFGAIGALIGGIAWGLVAYASNTIFLYGAILIGLMVCWAVFKGIGKINLAGKISAFVLTVASVVFGDAIFYTLAIARQEKLPVSMDLLKQVLANLWEIETSIDGLSSIAFALIGAGIVIYQKRRPKFTPEFQRLGEPST